MKKATPARYMTHAFFFGIDWAGTPLGAPPQWPSELRQIVSLLLDSAQPMFVVWGAEKTLLFNDAFCEILGTRYAEALGQPLPLLWKEVWPDIEPFIEGAFQGQSTIEQNRPFKTWASDYEEVRYFTFSYTPVKNSRDEVGGAICIANDTTDAVTATMRLRQERDRLRNLFNDAPVFLAMGTTPEMRFTYANQKYEELVGRIGLVGKTVADVLPETAAQGFLDLLEHVRTSRKAYAANDVPYIRPGVNGPEKRYIDFIYQPVFDGAGEVEGILCAGYDVTEQHEAQEEAESLRERLEQTARLSAMAHMAATLAHELNQPLAAAMNYASAGMHAVPLEAAGSDAVRSALRETLKQIKRSGEIIKRARAAVARKSPATLPVNLRALVAGAVKSSYAAGGMPPEVAVNIEIDRTSHVFADQVQIEQVLQNLFRNAATAMGGAGHIYVAATLERDQIVISVRDSGPGLTSAMLKGDLFTPFLHSNTGMGIGLALSRTIVENHGGHITARNATGGGAIFTFSLPGLTRE